MWNTGTILADDVPIWWSRPNEAAAGYELTEYIEKNAPNWRTGKARGVVQLASAQGCTCRYGSRVPT